MVLMDLDVMFHRWSRNAGRNFEYFSEDTFLTSECMVQAVKGLQNAWKIWLHQALCT